MGGREEERVFRVIESETKLTIQIWIQDGDESFPIRCQSLIPYKCREKRGAEDVQRSH